MFLENIILRESIFHGGRIDLKIGNYQIEVGG